ncbi:MAG: beta strand repeat-containing protein, partial [Bacteroidota bacterium]
SSITFNTAGTTNASNITNARVFYTGTNPNFSTATQYGTVAPNPNGSFIITGTQAVATGVSNFWLAYDIASNAQATNVVDAECTSITVANVARTPIVTAPAGSREIKAPLNGVYTVGATGNFPTLTAAVNEASSLGISGPVTFSLIDQVYSAATGEVFPITLANVPGTGNPSRSITIMPALGNVAHIIGNATSIINVDNTKYVIIDGRDNAASTTRSLIIENLATGSSSAVRYFNDAIGGTLVYTEIRSANNNTNTFTSPVIGAVSILGTTRSIPFGNDSMRISNNYFTRSAGLAYTLGVVVDGQSLVAQNNNINIDSNDFNGSILTGVMVTGNNTGNGNNFNIRYNNFYDTAANNSSTLARVMINFIPGTASNNNFIGYNNIGGNQPLAAAGSQKWSFNAANTGSFTGIRTSVGPTTGVTVRSNRISNLEFLNTTSFSLFNGINSQSGVHLIDSNVIGSLTEVDNIRIGFTTTHAGIAISFPSQDFQVRANIVSGINAFTASASTLLRGINYGGSNNTVVIENNIVKSLNVNSTSTGSTTGASLIGILVTGGSNAQFIRNNQIGGSNPEDSLSVYNVSGGRVVGIAFSSGINTVENNVISNLRNRSTTSTGGSTTSQIIGISASSFTAGGVVRNNTINNLRSFGVGSTGITGIIATSGSTTFSGNNIYDLVTFSNNASTSTGSAIVGINIVTSGQIFNVLNNNIYEFNALTSALTSIVGIATVNSTQNVINGNVIRNLRSNSTSTSAITGILNQGSGLNQIIDGNTIHSLVSYNTTAAAIGLTGINASFSATVAGNSSVITRNNIHSFNIDATASTLANIFGITPFGNMLIANNAIRIGRDTAGLRNTRAGNYSGIRITSGTTCETRIYHNNVVVDANPAVGAGNSFALDLQAVNTLPGFTDVKNNIFVNTSENATATGNHFVTSVPLTYTTNLRMGYNIYQTGTSLNSFSGRRGATNYANMTALKAGYLIEGTSTNTDTVRFINRDAAFNAVDLHLIASNIAEGGGDPAVAAFVAVDMDSSVRSGLGAVDIGSDAGNFTLAADSIAPEITFTRLNNGPAINRTVTATIIDKYGVYTIDSMPRIYFNKNNGTWFSAPGTLVSGNQFNGTWEFTISGTTMGGVVVNDIIRYFVVAKDSLGGNLNSEPMFASGGVAGISVFPANPAQYTITDPIATTITVGTTGLYPTLTGTGGAFEAINNSVLQGNTTIELVSNITEPGTVQLNQWNELGAGGYTLTIRPQTTTPIILSGTVVNTNGLVRFNGVSR